MINQIYKETRKNMDACAETAGDDFCSLRTGGYFLAIKRVIEAERDLVCLV